MAKMITEYPIITITRAELCSLMSHGWREGFAKLKQLSALRGLIYNNPKRSVTTDVRFRAWFDTNQDLLQQNYAVDLTVKGTYVPGAGPFVTKGRS